MQDTLSASGTSKLSCYFVASSVVGESCNVFVTSSDVKLAMRNLNTDEDGSLPMPDARHWKCLAIVRGFSCFQHANNFQEAWIGNSTPKATIRDKVNAASHLTDLEYSRHRQISWFLRSTKRPLLKWNNQRKKLVSWQETLWHKETSVVNGWSTITQQQTGKCCGSIS